MSRTWWIVVGVAAIAIIGLAAAWYFNDVRLERRNQANGDSASNATADPPAIKAGKQLSNNKCQGEGAGELTRLPMDESDYAMIQPYGLVIGGHVTPIDHQYFSPTVFNSPRDKYPVYAMADAKLVDIQPRETERGTEYRLVFTISCTFFYYYDLVTSLAPDIMAIYDKSGTGSVDVDVRSGQVIGRIGGQTLDFAVWDTTKPLPGFVNPASYAGEAWKIYTADPLDYYVAEEKKKALAKYMRTQAPLSGKIDYDIDGKLIGNWFEEGSGGYAGPGQGNDGYWAGHLSIAPEYLDNAAVIVSVGSWNGGEAMQFMVKDPAIAPAEVGVASGVVKYELYGWSYLTKSGSFWDRTSLAKDLTAAISGNNFGGCVLFQLTDERLLKAEQFPGKKCSSVGGFSPEAKIYTR